jgi:hypothetical protein
MVSDELASVASAVVPWVVLIADRMGESGDPVRTYEDLDGDTVCDRGAMVAVSARLRLLDTGPGAHSGLADAAALIQTTDEGVFNMARVFRVARAAARLEERKNSGTMTSLGGSPPCAPGGSRATWVAVKCG